MTAHDGRTRDEQPALARDDELRQAEGKIRYTTETGMLAMGYRAALRLVMAAYDERGRERDAARAEVGRLREEAAQALVRQTQLKGMSVEDGAALLELDTPRELVIAWVYAARELLGDAPNYSETRIDFPKAKAEMEVKAAGEFDRHVLTVQRAGKLTPHEARQAAEAERDQLRAQRAAGLALADRAERGCLRWADPLPVPEWVGQLRQELGAPATTNTAPAVPVRASREVVTRAAAGERL